MSKRLEDLQPKVREAAQAALDEAKIKGIKCIVVYTLRSDAEQYALWMQGRKQLGDVNAQRVKAGLYPIGEKENRYTVTNCDGIEHKKTGDGHSRSAHQSGKALDVVPLDYNGPIWPLGDDPRWKQIADVFKAHGFIWGGEWKDFVDLPHMEYKE
ncbi:MAG: M15 family metallopeptidase [Candidatus Nanoarchaeia archaeon]|nr:M15 family metallopeptidase [Candidatus Nanoarchaeia archaeon]